jgi:hypothetical protein
MTTPRVSRLLLALIATAGAALVQGAAPESAQWYKGNLHTHSLWSDGDDYPEMIADWYKRSGYQFLAISDHNVLQQGLKWYELKAPVSVGGNVSHRGTGPVMEKYLQRFGPDWVQLRDEGEKRFVRLKPLDEYRSLLEEPGKFLMIPSEEITGSWKQPKTATQPERGGPVHINLTNPREFVKPVEAADAVTVMQQTLDAVHAQRQRTGQPMIAHWGSPDPAGAEGTEQEKYAEFVRVASQVARRVELFCAFPDEKLVDVAAVRAVGDQFKLAGEEAMKR